MVLDNYAAIGKNFCAMTMIVIGTCTSHKGVQALKAMEALRKTPT